MPSKSFQLSNKERLHLRKQALKLKRPPVLAVGNADIRNQNRLAIYISHLGLYMPNCKL